MTHDPIREVIAKAIGPAHGYVSDGHYSLAADTILTALTTAGYAITPADLRGGVACSGCEGSPAPENNPCAVCGLHAKPQQPTAEAKAIINELNASYLYGMSEKSDNLAKRIIAALSAMPTPDAIRAETTARVVAWLREPAGIWPRGTSHAGILADAIEREDHLTGGGE